MKVVPGEKQRAGDQQGEDRGRDDGDEPAAAFFPTRGVS